MCITKNGENGRRKWHKLFGQHKEGQYTPDHYSFDRHELLPWWSLSGSIQYLAQYIGKDFDRREEAGRDARRMSYGRTRAKRAWGTTQRNYPWRQGVGPKPLPPRGDNSARRR